MAALQQFPLIGPISLHEIQAFITPYFIYAEHLSPGCRPTLSWRLVAAVHGTVEGHSPARTLSYSQSKPSIKCLQPEGC